MGGNRTETKEKVFTIFQAKYNPKAKTQHIIPVDITKKQMEKVSYIALKAHKLLKCRGVSRSDFRFYKNKFSKRQK